MDGTEAITILERRKGIALPRHRALCDPSGPDYRPDYVAVVIAEALEASPRIGPILSPAPLPLAESIRLTRLRRACPHLRPGGCSCGADVCAFPWHRRRVNHQDCFLCLGATVE